jgi:hypothetical protein
VLFVDRSRCTRAMQRTGSLEETVRSEPARAEVGAPRATRPLVKLESRIDPSSGRCPPRRTQPASGAVDAVVGFANITAFVIGHGDVELETNADRTGGIDGAARRRC